MKRHTLFAVIPFVALFLLSWKPAAPSVFKITKGTVYFKSDAPLELIEARSKELRGLIDFEKETFAFTVKTASL